MNAKAAWKTDDRMRSDPQSDFGSPYSILIVDDDLLSIRRLELLVRNLLPKPLELFSAGSSKEAKEILSKERVHAVLLDKELNEPSFLRALIN